MNAKSLLKRPLKLYELCEIWIHSHKLLKRDCGDPKDVVNFHLTCESQLLNDQRRMPRQAGKNLICVSLGIQGGKKFG
jgi:hypothetical protein